MKVLVFSDTHLTHRFNSELFDYIANLVSSADQVVINGDFWDAYLTTFDQFCNSKWKKLFPLLKEKNTVYIFGNHDKQKFVDERVSLFSDVQVDEYVLKSGDARFHIMHGHAIVPAYDNMAVFSNPDFIRWGYQALTKIVNRVPVINSLFHFFEHRKNLGQLEEMREYTQKSSSKGEFYLFGHCHIPELSIPERFICLGRLQEKYKSYCYIEDGKVDFFSGGIEGIK